MRCGLPPLLTLLLLAAPPASAQVSADVHVGLGIPRGDFAELTTVGLGYGVGLAVELNRVVGAYGRYHGAFIGAAAAAGDTTSVDGQGFSVGAQLSLPVAAAGRPWVRAGASFVVTTLNLESGVSIPGASGPRLRSSLNGGFELAAGLDLPVLPGGQILQPAIHYRSYSADGGDLTGPLDVAYVVLSVGAKFYFGGS